MRAFPLRLTLWGIAIVATMAGVVFLLLPVRMSDRVDPAIPSAASVMADPASGTDSLAAEEVVMANIFSSKRSPPSTRYQPTADSMAASGGAGDAAAVAMEQTGDAPASSGPVLFGTVVGVNGAPSRALLLLDVSKNAPRLYAEGERDGGYRVVSISPRTVVLSSVSGRTTLRLDPEEKRP